MGVLRGGIICESLKPGTTLEGFELRITRWSRYEISEPAPNQPSVWTLIEFEADADSSDALAQRLSKSLDEPGWYANWNTEDESVVVFPEKIFRYKRGDKKGRAKAVRYGLDCGVPKPQIDWAE